MILAICATISAEPVLPWFAHDGMGATSSSNESAVQIGWCVAT
jgi:hypothetical protein